MDDDGNFCKRDLDSNNDVGGDEIDYEEHTTKPIIEDDDVAPEPPVLEGPNFQDVYDDVYDYDYVYGDPFLDYSDVGTAKSRIFKDRKEDKKVIEDAYDYSYTYGDLSFDYDGSTRNPGSSSPKKANTTPKPVYGETTGDDGWPDYNHKRAKRSVKKPESQALRENRQRRSIESQCHSCNISTLRNNPFRPNPEVFNQYITMFLNDNPDRYCPKAGHAAYGQVRSYSTKLFKSFHYNIVSSYFSLHSVEFLALVY